MEARFQRAHRNEQMDARFGFAQHREPVEKLGWLINMHPVSQSLTRKPFIEIHSAQLCYGCQR